MEKFHDLYLTEYHGSTRYYFVTAFFWIRGRYEKDFAAAFQKIMDDGYDRSNIWFIVAMKAEWFRDAVKEKWMSLRETKALEKTADMVVTECEKLSGDLGDEAWKIEMVKNIRTFVLDRIKWLDSEWGR